MRVKGSCTCKIDDCFTSESISDLFANKYISRNIEISTYDHSCVVSCNEVREAIDQLKDDGNIGLTSYHIKHGGNELGVHISMVFVRSRIPLQHPKRFTNRYGYTYT